MWRTTSCPSGHVKLSNEADQILPKVRKTQQAQNSPQSRATLFALLSLNLAADVRVSAPETHRIRVCQLVAKTFIHVQVLLSCQTTSILSSLQIQLSPAKRETAKGNAQQLLAADEEPQPLTLGGGTQGASVTAFWQGHLFPLLRLFSA